MFVSYPVMGLVIKNDQTSRHFPWWHQHNGIYCNQKFAWPFWCFSLTFSLKAIVMCHGVLTLTPDKTPLSWGSEHLGFVWSVMTVDLYHTEDYNRPYWLGLDAYILFIPVEAEGAERSSLNLILNQNFFESLDFAN